MVHTRGQGARPEGFSQYNPPKRMRKTKARPWPKSRGATRAPRAPLPAQCSYKDASTQTDDDLTSIPVATSAKRRRDSEGPASENAAKRQRKAVTPDQPKFLFSASRNRSYLTSPRARPAAQRESPFFDRALRPTGRRSGADRTPARSAVSPETPSTSQPTAPQGGLFGSVKKLFGFFAGTTGEAERQPEPEPEQRRQNSDSEVTEVTDTTASPSEAVEPSSPASPTPQTTTTDEPESPAPSVEILDSKIYNRDFLKRRRLARTNGGREQLAAMHDDADAGPADFNPVEASGTNKRKLASVNGHIPGPSNGGYGIDDSYLDVETEVQGLEDSQHADAQPSTPRTRPQPPQTPLRSALRQRGANFGTLGRSAKSVRIDSNHSVKHVYGQYGYAGEYHGSIFSDPSDNTDSSVSATNVRGMHSAVTLKNTKRNESPKFRLDNSIVDPNDESWRPSLANPSPGHFRVPDLDEYDDDDDDTVTIDRDTNQDPEHDLEEGHEEEVPPQPSTPRMSHAELPQQSPPTPMSSFTGPTDGVLDDTTESRLNKARSEAQKYKPARSSRLSRSEQPRSRSSSPPGFYSEFHESQVEVSSSPAVRTTPLEEDTPSQEDSTLTELDETPSPPATPPPVRPVGREELDTTIVGEDGLTDYQREHQYDDWAQSLDWPEPQTYEDAGVASSYITNLVRKNWTARDTRESVEFWSREFDEGLEAARDAESQGREFLWITDPDEMSEV